MEFILGPLDDLFDIYIVKIWGKFIQYSWGFVSSRMFFDVGWMFLGLHDPSREGTTFLQDIGNCYLVTQHCIPQDLNPWLYIIPVWVCKHKLPSDVTFHIIINELVTQIRYTTHFLGFFHSCMFMCRNFNMHCIFLLRHFMVTSKEQHIFGWVLPYHPTTGLELQAEWRN